MPNVLGTSRFILFLQQQKSKEDDFSHSLSTLFFIRPCMQNLYFMEYKSNWSLEKGEILQTTT